MQQMIRLCSHTGCSMKNPPEPLAIKNVQMFPAENVYPSFFFGVEKDYINSREYK